MYSHIYEIIPATWFYGKITGQSYIVHLPYWFCAPEKTVCWSCLTVRQSNHFTTVLRTSESMQVLSFSSVVIKGHFSWCAFFNIWKRLLFVGDGSASVWSIDSAMLSLIHETFFYKWHPESKDLFSLQLHECDVLLRKLLLHVFHARTEQFQKQICMLLCFVHA